MIVHGSVDHTEASSMNEMVLLIPLWSRQRLLYSADHNWRSLHRLWFRWPYWGFVNGCDNYVDHWGLVHGCDGSFDYYEASSMAMLVLLITQRHLTWLWSLAYSMLWWFCWSHWSLIYLQYCCDGSVDHTEASSMVVMVLLITLKRRLWLWWLCHTKSLVYGCDGSDDHTEASSMVVMLPMITLMVWLWWFSWSHWSLVYGCDGSVDHTEASSMVVMVLLAPGSSFQAPDLYDKITRGDLYNQKWGGG
jgi:hypothetical protein